ncbi:hypothetical protein SKAU_G00300450 [Synaphobranchus kaupii]|uniref:Uncharacterized protein n=1 Tax=Synaphobranchus kaupii TaxID=118154 RepID=A0A9Q1IM92_SYNKA|nr:hypothetical protein SKAU_G00300450 [Synaphobranchus kaupii]
MTAIHMLLQQIWRPEPRRSQLAFRHRPQETHVRAHRPLLILNDGQWGCVWSHGVTGGHTRHGRSYVRPHPRGGGVVSMETRSPPVQVFNFTQSQTGRPNSTQNRHQ